MNRPASVAVSPTAMSRASGIAKGAWAGLSMVWAKWRVALALLVAAQVVQQGVSHRLVTIKSGA